MTNHRSWLLLILLSACATTPKPAEEQKMAIKNIVPFDLATCSPRALTLPSPANREALVGALVAQSPVVSECLFDAKSRTADEASAQVELTVGAEVTRTVKGTNLTPAGQACIEAAIGKLPLVPQPPPAPSVSASAGFAHVAANGSVVLGINDASNVTGAIRLATPQWCDCLAAWGDKPPRTLEMKIVRQTTPEGTTTTASPTPTGDAGADQVATCLKERVEKLPMNVAAQRLELTYPFLFINSNLDADLVAGPGDLRFRHLDALRGQRNADTALAVGARVNAVTAYDELVKKYKANPASVAVKDLKGRCAQLLKTDDAWIASLQAQASVDDRTVKLVAELKASDPRWGEAEATVGKTAAQSADDLATAKKTRVADEAVCPKETSGCCTVCEKSQKPCGDSCIPAAAKCTKAAGCACR